MEEQRQRQEDEQRRALAESDPNAAATSSGVAGAAVAPPEPATEEAMLQRALALSTETPVKRLRVRTLLFPFSFPAYLDYSNILSQIPCLLSSLHISKSH